MDLDQNRENIKKVVDDLMNFSMDSLDLGSIGGGGGEGGITRATRKPATAGAPFETDEGKSEQEIQDKLTELEKENKKNSIEFDGLSTLTKMIQEDLSTSDQHRTRDHKEKENQNSLASNTPMLTETKITGKDEYNEQQQSSTRESTPVELMKEEEEEEEGREQELIEKPISSSSSDENLGNKSGDDLIAGKLVSNDQGDQEANAAMLNTANADNDDSSGESGGVATTTKLDCEPLTQEKPQQQMEEKQQAQQQQEQENDEKEELQQEHQLLREELNDPKFLPSQPTEAPTTETAALELDQAKEQLAHMSFQTAVGHTSERKDSEIDEEVREVQAEGEEQQDQQNQREAGLQLEEKQKGEELSRSRKEKLFEPISSANIASDQYLISSPSSTTKATRDSTSDISGEDKFNLEEDKMEFTKNYSDDLLMGQSDGTQATNADLADFELPPYSGSSSGSEPTRQQSPTKRKSSSSSSTAHQQQASTSQQSSCAGFRGLLNLLADTYSQSSHVLQWKKPIESGIYFGIGVTLIIAFTFFSIISVVAYSALGIIMTSGLIRLYKSVMQTLNKSPELPFDHVWDNIKSLNVTISQDRIDELIDSSLSNINSSLIYFKQVLLFEDKIATLKFGFYFYLLTYIGSWFNGMTLITLCYLGMFTLPLAYEKNKTQVDQYFNVVQSHVCSTTNKITSMVFGNSKNGSGNKKQN